MDDELLGEFINESREHLTTIEADLLAIEEGGANIDVELVNKVFRAAHSIKGASGYFGLTKVKELAHKAETVLDMMRSKKMTPNAEITNLLLAAFDQLREMINHPAESAGANIDELVVNLTGLTSSYLPQEQKESLTQTVSLSRKGAAPPVVLSKFDYERSQRSRPLPVPRRIRPDPRHRAAGPQRAGGLPHLVAVRRDPGLRSEFRGRRHAGRSHRKTVAGAADLRHDASSRTKSIPCFPITGIRSNYSPSR